MTATVRSTSADVVKQFDVCDVYVQKNRQNVLSQRIIEELPGHRDRLDFTHLDCTTGKLHTWVVLQVNADRH